jgi:uncharacterized protein
MTEVFADAFYYIALLNPADRYHAAAVQATHSLKGRLVTTQWVLMEVGDALSDPAIRKQAHGFLVRAEVDPNTSILAETVWYSRGLNLYGNRLDKSWSLTDCISFEVMSDRGITEALTGDQHFIQAGFLALLHPSHAKP